MTDDDAEDHYVPELSDWRHRDAKLVSLEMLLELVAELPSRRGTAIDDEPDVATCPNDRGVGIERIQASGVGRR